MPTPPFALSHTAQRLYDAVEPLTFADHEHGWALARLCQGYALQIDEVADLARDDEDGRAGWGRVLDPDEAPATFLRWLGQLYGVAIPVGTAEADARARILGAEGFSRGGPPAMIAAAQAHLAGTKTVYLQERHGSPWRVTVATLTTETPNPAAVAAAIKRHKPAGLILTHSVIPGGDFDTLRDTHTDFADVTATFADFDELRADPAKQ